MSVHCIYVKQQQQKTVCSELIVREKRGKRRGGGRISQRKRKSKSERERERVCVRKSETDRMTENKIGRSDDR